MRIPEMGPLHNMIRSSTGAERRETTATPGSFRNELQGLTQENALQKLNDMGLNLQKQGEILARRCDIVELKRYKEKLGEFMHEAVRFAFEFKKQSTLDARGRHRIYALIKKLNDKIEELTQQILSGEADQLAVLEAIDDIRGMLLDLYM